MGWIANFLGTGGSEPSSAQLATVIAEREAAIAEKIEAIERHRADVPAAAVQGNYLPEHTMAALGREVEADRVVLADLRAAHEKALEREEAAELQTRWQAAVESAEPVIVAVSEIASVVETLDGPIEKLREALGAFEARVPWDPYSHHSTVTNDIGSARLTVDAWAESLQRVRAIRECAERAKASAASAARQAGPQEPSGEKRLKGGE